MIGAQAVGGKDVKGVEGGSKKRCEGRGGLQVPVQSAKAYALATSIQVREGRSPCSLATARNIDTKVRVRQ